MTAIVFDTDIGTDVDDILALGLALRSPELELAAITVVHGDLDLRARMVAKTLALAGAASVPLGRGISLPLLRQRPIYWPGHEGVGLLTEADPTPPMTPAVDLIIQTVRARPGQITLVPIGPLTNVAAAVILDPGIVPLVKEVVMMAGVAGRGADLDLPVVEHNIRLDPEAAAVVFAAGWPITMIGLDVTTRVNLTRAHLARLAAGDALARAIGDQAGRYMTIRGRDFTHLHDPLAVMTLLDPSLVTTMPLHIAIELHGAYTTSATVATRPTAERPANAQVALTVDADRAVALFLNRLTGRR
ncbi:MAG: nucleoside hydrolase [Chloroflexi bacterium]|nr:nucleoside hydrolase [Chloroflexota bacterium]